MEKGTDSENLSPARPRPFVFIYLKMPLCPPPLHTEHTLHSIRYQYSALRAVEVRLTK